MKYNGKKKKKNVGCERVTVIRKFGVPLSVSVIEEHFSDTLCGG